MGHRKPIINSTMETLVEQLQAKAEAFLAAVAQAQHETSAKIEQRVAEEKAKAEAERSEFDKKVEAGKSKFLAQLDSVKAKIETKKAEIREKIDETKKEHQLTMAQWQAEDAEEFAKEAVAIALFHIDEAKVAVLEAVAAKIKVGALKAGISQE